MTCLENLMTRILIAIDGSAAAIRALEYAVRRKRRGERIEASILNVQRAISPKAGFITRGMIKDFQFQESEKVLGDPKVASLKRCLKADAYMEIGDPAERIIAFAEKAKCEEVVIGSRGLGSIKGAFLGSVANKVIHMSPMPVIVVK